MMSELEIVYAELRPRLFSIAYRMVGRVGDAEDIVQEAFVRLQATDTAIESPAAYLTTITTRLAIDHLRLARVNRESYIGTWLPEPLLTDPTPGPDDHAELAESLSYALLTILERLSPTERAVFLLHETFRYPYDEIARIIGKSEANCRQVATRARQHLGSEPRFDVAPDQHEQLIDRFVQASRAGDVGQLLDLLAADVVIYSDSDGKQKAARKPVYGREKVAHFIAHVSRPERSLGIVALRPAWINDQPGRILLDADGNTVGVLSLDIAADRIQTIRIILNPDKLQHLQPR